METLVVNIFGGPCSGKTKLAYALTDALKGLHKNAEFVPEIAKQYLWAGREKELLCQPVIFGRQLENINTLYGQVDYIVVDSPILLSAVYSKGWPKSFIRSVIDIHKMYNSLNLFLFSGDWEYNDKHRRTDVNNEEISDAILKTLVTNKIQFYNLDLENRVTSAMQLLKKHI